MTAPARHPGRGRPRDPETDRAILDAALDLFVEGGAEAASMQAIAARAGVGKLTVYRRWSAKEELIAQAIEARRGDIPEPHGDTVAQAVERVIPPAVEAMVHPGFRAMLAQTLGSAQTHPRIMAAYWDNHILPRRRVAEVLLTRAVAEGLIPSDADFDILIDMMVGAVTYRVLQPRPLDRSEAERYLRSVYRQAGLLPAVSD
ncbi:TetR/AcrR family transcriptional regulator [Spiractinospora alimapuensis]|uniref:TetR/AcrR family transcriptional regulator n=1 Tax=Spiractinospora alimapuensis TaxID=2820884 RepID=UPI001F34BDE6|nr:TetR/AcrR family transcriptional regulator [Spiractinospora alimapuensis]QVQ51856.1 TetR/AcrR family transcriptional regulator [Spiractinospora alimapuensis]